MVEFSKLRLHGFKSFVDPTIMEIGAGMTGIVGPNGCGKSNLVEALRWVMGESSAKRMRGKGMEDVIFNGTGKRPARNTAEVSLWLKNDKRKAPAEFNGEDEIEIIRKIERDSGSAFRVNGKSARARDVQLLFADISIGANSPALVSQGRVADLISAKPTQRRLVLEEAAGISGLHVRRHEAELKLRAAENNLTRVEDVLGTMDSQMQGLKKQARQASRYRNLSGHIEKAEALLLYLQWQKADTAVTRAEEAFNLAESAVREHTLAVTRLTTEHTEKSTVLPALRKDEAESAAALQHLKLSHGMLEKEAQQLHDTLTQNAATLAQIESDITHEGESHHETETRIREISAEIEKLKSQDGGESGEELAQNLTLIQQLQDSVTVLEKEQEDLSALLAESAAEKMRRTQEVENYRGRKQRLSDKLETLKTEKAALEENLPVDNSEDIAAKGEEKEQQINEIQSGIEQLDKKRVALDDVVEAALGDVSEAQKQYTRLNTEIDTLENVLQQHDVAEDADPVLSKIDVDTGFEKALAVALGGDADAPENGGAPVYWTSLPQYKDIAPLPKGVKPLSAVVRAPKTLARRLAFIGVVDSDAEAANIIADLLPGQCLVSREGGAWRWDGLVITKEAPNAAAMRLEQKNRLSECRATLEASTAQLEKAETSLKQAREKREELAEELAQQRHLLREAEQELHNLRREHTAEVNRNAETRSRLQSMQQNILETEEEYAAVTETLAQAEKQQQDMKDDGKAEERLLHLKGQLTQKRQDLAERQSVYDRLLGAAESRTQRLAAMESDLSGWQKRRERMAERREDLEKRKEQALAQKQELASRPDTMKDDLQKLLTQIAEAETRRNKAADLLAEAETATQDLQRRLKEAENAQADARENRAHATAAVKTAQHTRDSIDAQIEEKFSCTVNGLPEKAEIKIEDENTGNLPDVDTVHAKLERLLRERENMGPVNLRAEMESEELAQQMETMTREKDDLIAAITRLRQGISKLNREARTRLLEAFEVVNEHFSDLFTRLFGGGTAHLEMTDAEDPLEAGVEIFAQPPGKKMQVLSLFSGGEQTLTSIALIFAMFLTNPAPICVLDEIDAPLDDSNVDRVCTLLDEISAATGTRFVVITHHRMTMARMHRLYGVTMSEQGVSQLVSVDLQQPSLLDSLAA
ncbi:MAG: chromosome segregation protein SMC [Pseudomonadota bacterium]|nr:chromosome segregation protein SMC [Pseudomonadota bacterium]QKK05079.1 MAG: chromosome segregation protein SMC [Pseudomonadota bacterium]